MAPLLSTPIRMAGPLMTGLVMDFVGRSGFFATLAVGFLAYSAYAAWRITRREMPDETDRTEFQVMAPMREQTPQTAELDPRSDPAYGEDSDGATSGLV